MYSFAFFSYGKTVSLPRWGRLLLWVRLHDKSWWTAGDFYTEEQRFLFQMNVRISLSGFHLFLSLRKQPSFFAPGPSGISRERRLRFTAENSTLMTRICPASGHERWLVQSVIIYDSFGPGAKKDGCFRRLPIPCQRSLIQVQSIN